MLGPSGRARAHPEKSPHHSLRMRVAVTDEIFSRSDADIGASSNHFEAVAMLSNGWSTENITLSSPSSRNAQRSGESENIPAVVIATLRQRLARVWRQF